MSLSAAASTALATLDIATRCVPTVRLMNNLRDVTEARQQAASPELNTLVIPTAPLPNARVKL